MTLTETDSRAPRDLASGVSASPVAAVDLDRFCDGCGYNLRTAAVFRDERTGIPIVRCPECGRFHSANDAATVFRPWFSRVTSVLLALWMILIIGVIGGLGLTEGTLNYATLDELTGFRWTTPATQGVGGMVRVGATGTLVVRDYPEEQLFVTFIVFLSFLAGGLCGMVPAVAFPHWRILGSVVLSLVIPMLAGVTVFVAWRSEAPHLLDWGLPYMAGHTAAQVTGGVLGAVTGRPLARLLVRVCLPPSVRPRLAWLWLADSKPLPKS